MEEGYFCEFLLAALDVEVLLLLIGAVRILQYAKSYWQMKLKQMRGDSIYGDI